MSQRKTPILLRRGPLSGRVHALTRYTLTGDTLKAGAKEDVTSDYYSLLLAELVDNGCDDIVGILDGVADGEVLTDSERVQVRTFRERLKDIIEAHNARLGGASA